MISSSSRSIVNSGFIFTTFGAESLEAINDCRMLLALIVILILTDLWWGSRETLMHYREAIQAGSPDADKWKFHKSRAGRRTMNKLVDYITYFLLGLFLGLSVFRQFGVSHTLIASVFVGFGGLFEVSSIIGHILAIHHVQTPKVTWKSFWAFLGKMVINLIKKKSPDTGEAIEEAIIDVNRTENENERNSD